MSTRRGIVQLDGRRVGVIEERETGTRFTYDAAWLAAPDRLPISLTLPLRPEPFDHRGLHPFFENLLPEGWLSTAKLEISKARATTTPAAPRRSSDRPASPPSTWSWPGSTRWPRPWWATPRSRASSERSRWGSPRTAPRSGSPWRGATSS